MSHLLHHLSGVTKGSTVGTGQGFLFYHSVQLLSKSLQGVSQATALQGRSFVREEIAEGESDGEGHSVVWAGQGRVEVLGVNGNTPLLPLFVFLIGTSTVVQYVQIPCTASDIKADLHLASVQDFLSDRLPSAGMESQELARILQSS